MVSLFACILVDTCFNQTDVPAGTVDIALLNTSNETLAFDAYGGIMQLAAYG